MLLYLSMTYSYDLQAELWSCTEVPELDLSINGEILSLLHIRNRLISSHSDGTIKVLFHWQCPAQKSRVTDNFRSYRSPYTARTLFSFPSFIFIPFILNSGVGHFKKSSSISSRSSGTLQGCHMPLCSSFLWQTIHRIVGQNHPSKILPIPLPDLELELVYHIISEHKHTSQ